MVTTDEGWNVLTRAMLHLRNRGVGHAETTILDHCRRLILVEEYPESQDIKELLDDSNTRMAALFQFDQIERLVEFL